MTDIKQEERQKKHWLNESESDEVDVSQMHLGLTREHAEPIEGHERMPVWLPALIVGLLVWAGYYVGRYGGAFDANSYDPVEIETSGVRKASETTAESPIERGKTVFRTTCMTCHQENGRGIPGQYPPLAGSAIVTKQPDAAIKIVLHGLTGPLMIEGKNYDGTMPAWGGTLSDAQIADVLTYVRASWGNRASAVTVDAVKKIRDENAGRGKPWTAGELRIPH